MNILNQQNKLVMETDLNKIPQIAAVKSLFDQINEDCAKSSETAVSYSDRKYYSQQIQNIYDLDDVTSDVVAQALYEESLIEIILDNPELRRGLGVHNDKYAHDYLQANYRFEDLEQFISEGTKEEAEVWANELVEEPELELDTYEKPPIGLSPKHIEDEIRIKNIEAAIARYESAGKEVPQIWVFELNQLEASLDMWSKLWLEHMKSR